MTVADKSSAEGLTLSGELLSVGEESGDFEGRPWVLGVVKVLQGDDVQRVSFRSLADAEAAVGGAARGDLVTLAVRAQGAWDESTGRRSRVKFRGVAVGG